MVQNLNALLMDRVIIVIILGWRFTFFEWLRVLLIMDFFILIFLITIWWILIIIFLNWWLIFDWILFCRKLNMTKLHLTIELLVSGIFFSILLSLWWALLLKVAIYGIYFIVLTCEILMNFSLSLSRFNTYLWRLIYTPFYSYFFHLLKSLCHLIQHIFDKLFTIFYNIF